ncbi:MAG: glycosyltransferase involved in cell wall biosynthesis [Planctomycetota bacterium]|jgi:glycosyltransferase involved in cell wall biosynthesis
MRILLVLQKLPLPLQDGYNLRIYHYVRRLAERHEIHLLSLEQGQMPDEMLECFASVGTHPMRTPPQPRSLLQKLGWAVSVEQFHDRDPEVSGMLADTVAAYDFDLIWVSGWAMLVYADLFEGTPLFADAIDEGALEAWIEFKKARDPVTALLRLKRWYMTRDFERHYFRKSSLCALVSDADCEAVQHDVPRLETCVVHNGVDPDHFAPMGTTPVEPSLIFEGTMAHVPNAEGIVHFVQHSLPLIHAELPEVRLFVVGRDPTPEVLALAGTHVEVTGFVDDVRPWLDKASVFVSPLIGGAGIKNKVLQAWSMAKAVVATPISSGGLLAVDGENIVSATTPRELADACLRLLRDREERERIAAAGRQTVLDHYSWDAKAEELDLRLRQAAGQNR